MTPATALVALHFAVALFGFAGLFGKWLALAPEAIVLGRTAVAAATLAAVVGFQRVAAPASPGLALSGAILALHWVAFFAAVQVSTVAIGLLGFASFPLFVLVLERALLGRRWSRREAGVAALVTAGLVLLVPSFAWSDRTVQGLAYGVAAGASFAWLAVRNRDLAASMAPSAIALWQNAFAALCLIPIVLLSPRAARWPSGTELALIAYLGVFCTAIAHTLFIGSLRRLSAHTASVVAALEPVYGIALALALLGEVPDARTWVGAVLIVGAALFATRAART